MTTNPPPTSRPPSRRPAWTRALYVLLLASGIFAAWQLHEVWQSSKVERPSQDARPSRPPLRAARRTKVVPLLPAFPAPATGSQPATGLADLADDAFPDSAVEALEGDPVDIVPPPDAKGLRAFSLPGGGVTAQYVWRGSLAEAAEHYKKALREQGCKLLDNSVDASGKQSLKFTGEGRRVVVALRTDPQNAKIAVIEVTVIRLSK